MSTNTKSYNKLFVPSIKQKHTLEITHTECSFSMRHCLMPFSTRCLFLTNTNLPEKLFSIILDIFTFSQCIQVEH